jgi:uncharacterized protein (DUF302 family)
MAEPFDLAVKSLRRVFAQAKLTITAELNMSARIQQNLLISTAPCLVLFVSPPVALLATFGTDPCAAALTPLHIVVSGRGPETEVHVLRLSSVQDGPLDPPAMQRLSQMQAEISRAIEQVGMRAGLCV